MIGLLALTCYAENASMLVSTEWLAAHLRDPKVVVLHVGSEKDYEAGHVPGARLVKLADISITGPRDLRLELPSAEQLAAALSKLGVANDSRIVIYPAGESIQSATRVWFTLDYLGLGEQTALLNGGLAAWKAENRVLSTEPVKAVESKPLRVRAHPDLVVDAAWLSSQLKSPALDLIDARLPDFYTGADAGAMPRAGHIPGARNLPYAVFLENGKWKPAAEIASMLKGGSGQVVTYCHIGQQATVPYFAARYVGLKPKLYDGSFQDWSNQRDLPVEQGAR